MGIFKSTALVFFEGPVPSPATRKFVFEET